MTFIKHNSNLDFFITSCQKNKSNRRKGKTTNPSTKARGSSRELLHSPDACPHFFCYCSRKLWKEGSGHVHGQWEWGHQRRCIDEEMQRQFTHSLPLARTQQDPATLHVGAAGRCDWFQSGVCRTQYVRLWASLPLPLVAEEPSISHPTELQAGHPARGRWVPDRLCRLLETPELVVFTHACLVFLFFFGRFICWGRPPYKLSVCQQKYPDSSLSTGTLQLNHTYFTHICEPNCFHLSGHRDCHRNEKLCVCIKTKKTCCS